MKKHSTGAMITRGSSIPSTSKEKPLRNYQSASTKSCHDFYKYGWKEPLETDTKLPSVLPKLNDNMKKHSTGGMIITGSSLPSTSKKKALSRYLRASTNSCHNFCKDGWKLAFETDTKPLSVFGKLNNNLGKHSTGGRITTGSSLPSTSKVKPLPRYLRASSNSCHDFCKHGRKQAFEAERKRPSFLLKVNNKSKKLSIGGRITTGISLPSVSKVLPRYLRASTNSCHDFCKYGWKYDFKAVANPLCLPNSINKLTLRDESYQVNKLNVEERNPSAIKLKPSSHRKANFPDRPAVSKEMFSSKKEDGFLEFPVKFKLQSPISTRKSSISNDHKVIPISTNEESQVRYTNLRDQKMKQVIKSKNLIKSHSFSYHHKVGKQSTDNGFDAQQKTGIIKKSTSSVWDASLSFKPKLVKQKSLKSNITYKIPVPSKITPVSAASKKVSKITTVALSSVLSPSHEPTGRRNGKEVLAKSGEKKDMLEKMSKPSTVSPSLMSIGDGVLSLNQRKHKHGKKVIPDKNQEVGRAPCDNENIEEKTLSVDKRPEKADLDPTQQKSSKMGNVVCDSSKQPLLKCENSDMDFPLHAMLEPENADICVLGLKWQEVENIILHSFELNLDHQKLLLQTSVDINFPEQKLLNPENSENVVIVKPENADMGILGKNFLELENGNVDSFELDLDDQKLFEQKNADIDFLKQKLMNPENLENVNILKSGNTNMSVLGQTLLELDNINLHLFGLNPDDQEQKNVDMDFLEKNLLNPEKIDVSGQNLLELEDINLDSFELNPENKKLFEQKNIDMDLLDDSSELKHDEDWKMVKLKNVDMSFLEQDSLMPEEIDFKSLETEPSNQKLLELGKDYMDFPELKLLKQEDINLVDTLELKSDGADVNFLHEKLLKLENIDVDALELKRSDDRPSQSATDDVEEIEESKSASSETTESKSEQEIKEDNDMDYMDSPELKLLKPEDINLVGTLEPKSDGINVTFLQEKLLKLENIDVDALELKPSDDQPSQSATDDVEVIEETKSSSSETTESDSEHEIKEDNDNCESLKSEQKRGVRRDAIVLHLEDEFSIPHKLKFMRSKAIELHPENNDPKRLRFRRGRIVGRNVNSSHLERENFRRSEMGEVVTDSKPETQSIVLKHQDTQKKDVRGLFNNVIEETTSKLVETRKSKVKALIGAFETVISLQ
ncbi:hypothetical protein OPV22_005860 [Ensete ventricosum]|uniref:Calmodulin-binding domain-containing protein n=1 Tax=Ensete ventricosum TaxID=4639 RepID=A0AAV8RNG9_ENSVE|nr:hypothetical protein OPV22_005860 [Ensete ventricosum]